MNVLREGCCNFLSTRRALVAQEPGVTKPFSSRGRRPRSGGVNLGIGCLTRCCAEAEAFPGSQAGVRSSRFGFRCPWTRPTAASHARRCWRRDICLSRRMPSGEHQGESSGGRCRPAPRARALRPQEGSIPVRGPIPQKCHAPPVASPLPCAAPARPTSACRPRDSRPRPPPRPRLSCAAIGRARV
jgi:hypothetical protein